MEFYDDGSGKSYDTIQASCNDREQRLCTYNEICPNGRFHEPVGGEHNYDDMWLPIDGNEWVQTGRGTEGWCQLLSGSSTSYDPSNWATTDVAVDHKRMYACCNHINDSKEINLNH